MLASHTPRAPFAKANLTKLSTTACWTLHQPHVLLVLSKGYSTHYGHPEAFGMYTKEET